MAKLDLDIGTRLVEHTPSFVYILAARRDSDETASIADLREESRQVAKALDALSTRMLDATRDVPLKELEAAAKLGNGEVFTRLRQEIEAQIEEIEDAREAYRQTIAREEAIVGEIGRRLETGAHTLGLALEKDMRSFGSYRLISTQPLCPAELIIFRRIGQKFVEETYNKEDRTETFDFNAWTVEGDEGAIVRFSCGTDYDRDIPGDQLVDAFASIVPAEDKAMIGYVEMARMRLRGETRRDGRKVD